MRKNTSLVGIMTDFGHKDHYVGVMKAVLASVCPDVRIIDITHEVGPHNVQEGAYLLWASYKYFPAGSVIMAVVDPGVGTSRGIIGAKIDGRTVLGPRNGMLDLLLWEERVEELTTIDLRQAFTRKLLPPSISTTFHGRDLFAPLAAHLASGKNLTQMGLPTKVDWITPPFVEARSPETTPTVLHIDRFGNIVTNIRHDVPGVEIRRLSLKIGRRHVRSWVDTYKAIKPGEICMIRGSSGLVEIVMKERSAASYLRVRPYSLLQIQSEP